MPNLTSEAKLLGRGNMLRIIKTVGRISVTEEKEVPGLYWCSSLNSVLNIEFPWIWSEFDWRRHREIWLNIETKPALSRTGPETTDGPSQCQAFMTVHVWKSPPQGLQRALEALTRVIKSNFNPLQEETASSFVKNWMQSQAEYRCLQHRKVWRMRFPQGRRFI